MNDLVASITEETLEPENEVFEIQPDQIENVVLYQQLQFSQDPRTGEIETGIVQVPIPRAIVEGFKTRFGKEMAAENLELVIVKDKMFLAPYKRSSLIGFD